MRQQLDSFNDFINTSLQVGHGLRRQLRRAWGGSCGRVAGTNPAGTGCCWGAPAAVGWLLPPLPRAPSSMRLPLCLTRASAGG